MEADSNNEARCPDCGCPVVDHNAVNKVPAGFIVHCGGCGACWNSVDTLFVELVRESIKSDGEQNPSPATTEELAAQGDGRSGLAALNTLAADVLAMCKVRGWSLHWTHRGAYLHLETSELIEAVRGKRGSVVDEAGDVLLVLMSITEYAGIPFTEVVGATTAKVDGLFTKPHYAGEECLPSEAGTDLLDTLRAAANFIIKPSGREPETREVVIKALDIAIRKEEGNCAALDVSLRERA